MCFWSQNISPNSKGGMEGEEMSQKGLVLAKALRLVVAIVVLEIGIFLGPIVPCQLKYTFPVSGWVDAVRGLFVDRLISRVSKEIEIEFISRVF